MTREDIIAFRRKYHFSQSELADATGFQRGYIASVEQGRKPVTGELSFVVSSFVNFVGDCERNGRL